ncbi:hypothetical protein Q3G72_027779 [Acer saccharum]|nr:hypothetical protein Q3G72_027779 [Acer saccharum]
MRAHATSPKQLAGICALLDCADCCSEDDSRPYFRNKEPLPPPVMCPPAPPTPTLGQQPAGKPWTLLFSAML